MSSPIAADVRNRRLVDLTGQPVSPVILKRMTDAIAHRGPDGEGQWIEGAVGLGHRRLAIIDLSPAGHQPMISAGSIATSSPTTARSTTSANCAPSWRRAGYWFRSRTDTEVVLHALGALGRRCARRASTACSRSRSGTARSAVCSSPATATASSRYT